MPKILQGNCVEMRTNNRIAAIPAKVLMTLTLAGALVGAGYFFWPDSGDEGNSKFITSVVQLGVFTSKVTEQGGIQSADNVDIRSQVVARNGDVKVIDLVAEGTFANEGDWLVTLDGSQFEKELEQKQLEINTSETGVIQAQAAYDISVASEEEYLKGTFVESKKKLENAIFDAQRMFAQATESYDHSKRLQLKGYITGQKLVADEFAVSQAKNSLELAEQQMDVLNNITRRKELIRLKSDIASAKISLENAKQAKAILERQLAEIKQQLEHCKIKMPEGVSGEVVYARNTDPDSRRERVLALGSTVRERQILIQIPNRAMMEVEVLINEQNITSIRKGMAAKIEVDALKGVDLLGSVTKVNSYADPGEWYSSSSVKKYAVIVRIENPPETLKPGMNATVSIQTVNEPGALQVPLQCVYSIGSQRFVFRIERGQFETVSVNIGGLSANDVWVRGELNEGDEILMDPISHLEVLELPELRAPESLISQDSETEEFEMDSDTDEFSDDWDESSEEQDLDAR